MRLPAVAIAAAFACGIVLGLHPAVARHAASHILLSSFFIFIGVLVLAGIILVSFSRDRRFPSELGFAWITWNFHRGTAAGREPRHLTGGARTLPLEDAFAMTRPSS